MKICVCGKGGSGKSTVTCLLAMAFRRAGKNPVVLDSDESNTSLFWMLGFETPPRPLMELVGGKKEVQRKMMAQFSKGKDEPAMTLWERETISTPDIPSDCAPEKDGITLVATGKILQALEGCACPMGSISKEFLRKFQTAENEVMLVDMEAGIEHFGRGLESGVDRVISVVEPSLESVTLSEKIMQLSHASGATFSGAVLNKVNSEERKNRLAARLSDRGVPVVGCIPSDEALQAAGLDGAALTAQMIPAEMDPIVRVLLNSGQP